MQYVLKRDLIEHARLRALATSIINKEKAAEIFEEYRKEAFPWVETQKKRETDSMVHILQDEVKKGAMGIRPLWEANNKIRSRMKTKVIEAEKPLIQKKSKEEIASLYSKLGTVRP